MTKIIESGCGNTTILAGDEVSDEIIVSTIAKEKIAEMLVNEDPGSFLRVAVMGGGCSGFRYLFGFDTELDEDDITHKWENGQVVVDNMSIDFIKGGTLHYVVEFGVEYFHVVNPSAKSQCGCGSSFSM